MALFILQELPFVPESLVDTGENFLNGDLRGA